MFSRLGSFVKIPTHQCRIRARGYNYYEVEVDIDNFMMSCCVFYVSYDTFYFCSLLITLHTLLDYNFLRKKEGKYRKLHGLMDTVKNILFRRNVSVKYVPIFVLCTITLAD